MDNQLLLGSLFCVLIHIWLVLNLISKVHMDLAVWAATFSWSLGVSLKYLTGLLIVVLLQCVHLLDAHLKLASGDESLEQTG
jgi:uncharacterized integral membrane protein